MVIGFVYMIAQSISINNLVANKGQIEGVPSNPRTLRDQRFFALRKSLIDAPEMLELRELIVYPHKNKFVVIGGNMRLAVMKDLGYTHCLCKVLPIETTDYQLRGYIIRDNVSFGEDDTEMLANEWDDQELTDFGYEIPVFEEPETEEEPEKQTSYTKLVVMHTDFSELQAKFMELQAEGFVCELKE